MPCSRYCDYLSHKKPLMVGQLFIPIAYVVIYYYLYLCKNKPDSFCFYANQVYPPF